MMRTGDRSRHEGHLGGRIGSPLRWVEFGGNRRDGVKEQLSFFLGKLGRILAQF